MQPAVTSASVPLWRSVLFEAVGTMLLMLLTGMTTGVEGRAAAALLSGVVAQGGHALFAGLANPAICVGGYVAGRISLTRTVALLIGEIIGTVLAICILSIVPNLRRQQIKFAWHGKLRTVILEITLGAMLTGVWSSLWRAQAATGRRDYALPLKVALASLAATLAAGGLTAAAGNPIRSLEPLAEGQAGTLWPQWVGPLLGSALSAAFHRYILFQDKPTADF